MSQHSDKFLDETIKFWRSRMRRELSREDARQIVENFSGFFTVLIEWDTAQRSGCEGGGHGNADPVCEVPARTKLAKSIRAQPVHR